MKAIIMAGGKGTRLHPLTKRAPKPMLQLLDRPTMEYIVELLSRHQFDDITVTVCYMSDVIQNHFSDGKRFGVRIRYEEERVPLGTAGGVKQVEEHLQETFIVMSGDGLTDVNLTKALEDHHKHGGMATLLLVETTNPAHYGTVDIDKSGRVKKFVEKPKTWIEGQKYLINTGIYILEPRIFCHIPKGEPFDFGRDLFPSLVQQNIPIYGCKVDGYWSDVGTLNQYYQSQLDMINGRVNVSLPIDIVTV